MLRRRDGGLLASGGTSQLSPFETTAGRLALLAHDTPEERGGEGEGGREGEGGGGGEGKREKEGEGCPMACTLLSSAHLTLMEALLARQ